MAEDKKWWEEPEPDQETWWDNSETNSEFEQQSNDVQTNTERDIKKERFRTWLASKQFEKDYYPTSNGPKNKVEDLTSYDKVLREYKCISGITLNKNRFDCEHPNRGYKLHLNVLPENVIRVSTYLKNKGYIHKYIKGGDPDDKTFTIYIGSLDLTRKLAQEISEDLSGLLCFPAVEEEIEFAPNVVGRFHVKDPNFSEHPFANVRGISTLIKYEKAGYSGIWEPVPEDITKQAFNETFDALAEQFGKYFYGT